MSRRNLKELVHGDTVNETFLVADKQLRANRNADLYLLLTLRDSSGQMSGLMWNVTEESVAHFGAGDYVKVRGKVQLYQGGLQMIMTHIDAVDPAQVDPEEFLPQTSPQTKANLEKLQTMLLSVRADLRGLVQCFLSDQDIMSALASAPAGMKAHHAYPGGLLEHVVTMMTVAEGLRPVYPDLDVDLLLVGVFLHDLGKVRELTWESTLGYTDEGQLIGHMPIGVEMVNEKLSELSNRGEILRDETIWRIKHMIISHHGTYEFGSSRLPMTPEAIALHYIDNLDAKLYEFQNAIVDDPDGDSNWTPFNPRIQRKLYKGERREHS